MGGDGVDLEAIAEGLWLRLRDVILAERRLERFTFAPEMPEAGVAQRLAALAADPGARSELARDVALRALGAAAEGVNFRVLSGLSGQAPVPLVELARRLGVPALALGERINALAQLGLASRDLERDAALPTPAGLGVAALIDALARALGERLSRELPALLGS